MGFHLRKCISPGDLYFITNMQYVHFSAFDSMRRAEFQEFRRDRSLSSLEKENDEIYLDETSRVGKLKWLTGKNVTGLMVSFFFAGVPD